MNWFFYGFASATIITNLLDVFFKPDLESFLFSMSFVLFCVLINLLIDEKELEKC